MKRVSVVFGGCTTPVAIWATGFKLTMSRGEPYPPLRDQRDPPLGAITPDNRAAWRAAHEIGEPAA
ncbi:hypothetical protein KCP75_05075 [Salmonella enterica subsp. enterica]|nr:hypothetical protein KCP75_05075 [Salmonella enterica subsp. enterica]